MRQPDAQPLTRASDVLSGRCFRASQRRGNLLVGLALDGPHEHGGGLLSGKAMNGRHDLGILLPARHFGRRQLRSTCLLVGPSAQLDNLAAADRAARNVIRRVNTNLQYKRLGVWVPADSIPSLQDGQQGILHRVLGILRIANNAPDRPDHAVFDGTDDPIVGLLRIVHVDCHEAPSFTQLARHGGILIIVTALGTGFVDKKMGIDGQAALQ